MLEYRMCGKTLRFLRLRDGSLLPYHLREYAQTASIEDRSTADLVRPVRKTTAYAVASSEGLAGFEPSGAWDKGVVLSGR